MLENGIGVKIQCGIDVNAIKIIETQQTIEFDRR